MLQAHLLRVEFKFDLAEKDSQRALGTLVKNVRRWARVAMHCKRSCALVIVTDESSAQLLARLRPVLEEFSSVDNYWCHAAPPAVVARHGGMDPLVTRVAEAVEEIRQRRSSQHMRYGQRR